MKKRQAAQQPMSNRSNTQVSYLSVPQFGTIPARINMIGGLQEPAKLTGLGLNQMEPKYVQPANIQEPATLHHFGLNMMVPVWTSPLTREVTSISLSRGEGRQPSPPPPQRYLTYSTSPPG